MSIPWDTLAKIGGLVALEVALLAGLIAIPLGLSGTFIILGIALVVGLISHFVLVPWWALLVMGALVIGAEIIEAALGPVMARRYGASKWGMLGAFVGGIGGAIVGTPVVPVLGSIIGSFVGAAVGAVLLEYWHLRQLDSSLPAGWGTILGRLISSLIKICIGLAMVIYLQIRVVPSLFS